MGALLQVHFAVTKVCYRATSKVVDYYVTVRLFVPLDQLMTAIRSDTLSPLDSVRSDRSRFELNQ